MPCDLPDPAAVRRQVADCDSNHPPWRCIVEDSFSKILNTNTLGLYNL
jgi:hypothetical protein